MTALAARIDVAGFRDGRPLVIAQSGSFTLGDLAPLIPPRMCEGKATPFAPTVALALRSTVEFIRALLALDGFAAGILLLAPSLPRQTISALMREAHATLLIADPPDITGVHGLDSALKEYGFNEFGPRQDEATQWFMTTSGTTGSPKIVRHTLDRLTQSIRSVQPSIKSPKWGLLYDPSRFAGLQVVLHSLLAGGALIAPDRAWPWLDQLDFLERNGCTHLSASPTLWRRILMAPNALLGSLEQITLGGETADEPLLNALARQYPRARITHIYASTEAGVGFSVKDGRAGFPASYLEKTAGGTDLKVVDGILWLRPARSGADEPRGSHILRDSDGYIRSGDRVRIDGQRVYFCGREDGVVNVAGVKLQIETIENIVLEHPDVVACTIVAKRNPVVGALLVFNVVPKQRNIDKAALLADLKRWCKDRLQREAQPASIQISDEIVSTAAGKTPRSMA